MTLTSRIFSGNRALEACAVQDSAHVTRGATGDHVAKIQFALFELDGVVIDRTELVAHQYGRSTAAAVLAYKAKRQIINRSYQNSADDIVGKMTIASLDKDMSLRERLPKRPGDCALSPPGIPDPLASISTLASGNVAGSARSLAGTRDRTTTAPRQLGGFIRVFFQTTLRSSMENGFPLSANIELARDLLLEHGITLIVEVAPGFADTLQFSERILNLPGEPGDNVNQLRKASEDARPGLRGVLRAIVCQMVANEGGETFRDRTIGTRVVPPFVLLNSELLDPSRATLIHEMIHASKPGPLQHDRNPASVFSDLKIKPGSVARTFLPPEHAETLSKLSSKL